MSATVLQEGQKLMYRDTMATVKTIDRESIVLELHNGCKQFTLSQYQKAVTQGYIKEAPATFVLGELKPLLSEDELFLAQRYSDYLSPLKYMQANRSLERIAKVIETVALKRGDTGKNKPSAITVYHWLVDAETKWNFDYVAMVNAKKRKPGWRVSDECRDLFFEIIDRFYLKSIKPGPDRGLSKSECWLEFRQAQEKLLAGLSTEERASYKGMKRSSFMDKLNQLDPVEVCIAREGYDKARRMFRGSAHHIVAERPLELVQIDAVHINVGLLDCDGNFVGMPVIFFAIDVFTRTILGYVISYAHKRREDMCSAIELLKVSIQEKQKPAHTKHGWPLHGKIETVQYDSGVFSSKLMSSYLLHIGVNGRQTQPRSPWQNAFIERFHRTFRESCCTFIPGYEGSRNSEKKDSTPIKQSAAITEIEFKRIVETFILDKYHQRPHGGLGQCTPADMAENFRALVPPLSPDDIRKLDLFHGVETEFTIQAHKGIVKNNIWYHDKAESIRNPSKLVKIYNKHHATGKQVKVKGYSSRADVSAISVIDPDTGELFKVPSTLYDEPISLSQHQARTKAGGKIDPATAVNMMSPQLQSYETNDEVDGDPHQPFLPTSSATSTQSMPPVTQNELEQCITDNAAGQNMPPALAQPDNTEKPAPPLIVKKNVKPLKM
ncbi:integrase core domain-containing protein [Pseudoalteromonas sp. T1lg75]|uniref:integrase core domain-containing protein n=1 Tax=Pseudoalteromonas sp. T1lg75 TaxID=2077102 RepID=UPI000CF6542F|nr:integrase core domain-containing protein [Pseudoalteromonas sp. T1lg75]